MNAFAKRNCICMIIALLTVIAPAGSQGQADRVAEIQRSLDQATAEEAATKAKWEKELKTFEQARAEYEASLKTSKPVGRPIQVYEKKARADFDAAMKKRAALEAELAKAKAASVTQVPSTPKPAPPSAETIRRECRISLPSTMSRK